jgi:probable rRNA maturation factor
MVGVESRQRRVRVSLPRIRATARRTLRALGRSRFDVHVTLVDDPEMRRLHARYLGKRRATDVLAFDLAAPGPSPGLAEVVVSAETAARQARRLGVPIALELDLLVVHGLLHLSGYDDGTPSEAQRMHERERAILEAGRRGRRPIPDRLWTGLLP